MPAPTIYYIRHGETDWNANGRLQGAQDVALNGRGIEQAIHVGAVLEDLFARDGREVVLPKLSKTEIAHRILDEALRLRAILRSKPAVQRAGD